MPLSYLDNLLANRAAYRATLVSRMPYDSTANRLQSLRDRIEQYLDRADQYTGGNENIKKGMFVMASFVTDMIDEEIRKHYAKNI